MTISTLCTAVVLKRKPDSQWRLTLYNGLIDHLTELIIYLYSSETGFKTINTVISVTCSDTRKTRGPSSHTCNNNLLVEETNSPKTQVKSFTIAQFEAIHSDLSMKCIKLYKMVFKSLKKAKYNIKLVNMCTVQFCSMHGQTICLYVQRKTTSKS